MSWETAPESAVDWRVVGGIALGLVAVWSALVAVLWILRPQDTRLRELIRVVPDILRLVRSLVGDSRTPLRVRLALVGLLAWLINPLDLIPEFIPVLGPLDDVVVAVLVLRYARRRVGEAELRKQWPGTEDGLGLLLRLL
jgi:uncharacterized membrane protein YkvA (DUF1232 family)